VTEVFSQPENPTSNLAWNYSPFADSLFREYSHQRMRLFPYLYSYAHLSRLKGINMIRPLPGHLYEYMLGNELLVAPVFEKGAETRIVDLPDGRWIEYYTGELLEGGRRYEIAAPPGKIPLLVREGAFVPARPYASSIERGSNDTLVLNVYPGADCSFSLIEDDGVSNDYLSGGYAMTEINGKSGPASFAITINPVQGTFRGMTPERTWNFRIHKFLSPVKVVVNGSPESFSFDPATGETEINAGRLRKERKSVIRIFFE
jgi:alpha-glucosidase (family GH31 glycosyl hydrolase)